MTSKKQRFVYAIPLLVVFALLPATPLFAGFGGHNMKGDFGVLSASQPPPGFYAIADENTQNRKQLDRVTQCN